MIKTLIATLIAVLTTLSILAIFKKVDGEWILIWAGFVAGSLLGVLAERYQP